MSSKSRGPTFWPSIIICVVLGVVVFFPLISQGDEFDDMWEDSVETLDIIEVPATMVIQDKSHIILQKPDTTNLPPLPGVSPAYTARNHSTGVVPFILLRDSIADRNGVRKPVRPAKAERPRYPRFAREQGWEGTVVLRIRVNREGIVDFVNTRKSSGFPILDDSAVQSVKTWTFEPAKDGEFRIPVTVDLPIRFDLSE